MKITEAIRRTRLDGRLNARRRDSDDFALMGLPWSPLEFPFLVALLHAIRNVPGEVAFALGGSFASKSNVPLSDLDFFFYVGQQDAYVQAESLRRDLASHPSVVTSCPLHHYHSFGYRCSWTLFNQPVALVELFVASTLDLKATEMARMNHLIIDRSPTYRRHLAASQSRTDDAEDETLELVLHDLVASAQKTRKGIDSQSLLQAANRFYKFRMAMLPILIFEDTGMLHHPLVGEKHAHKLKADVFEAIQRSYRISSIADVALHFSTLTKLLQPGVRALRQSGRISPDRAAVIIDQLCGYAIPRY